MIAASPNPLQEAQYADFYSQGRDSPETVHGEQYSRLSIGDRHSP
jgi:hypothetical protein